MPGQVTDRPRHGDALPVGQSLELWRPPLVSALRRRDAVPIIDEAEAQLRAGARALDLNIGHGGDPSDLAWAAAVLSAAGAHGAAELWLDAAEPAVLGAALERCLQIRPDKVPALVLNAVTVGPSGVDDGARELLQLAASAGAGFVLSPRDLDDAGSSAKSSSSAPAGADQLLEALDRAADDLSASGLRGGYLDCLSYPAVSDLPRLRRSLDLLRLIRGHEQASSDRRPLVAVGNVSYGTEAALRPALRLLYATAAVGAGAQALLLPVEDQPLMALLELLAERRPTADATDAWLLTVAAGAEAGAPIEPPDEEMAPSGRKAALTEAWRLLFGSEG